MDGWQPTLDGLSLPLAGNSSAMEKAALATLRRLDELELLGAEHALTCQLVLELARAVGAGVRNGRASAVAMAAKELREALATLPLPTGNADAFEAFAEQVAAAAAREAGNV